ncbi:MAG: hypothetical protein K2Q26_03135 [Bdellovibrionales bacterium]|nr:hypothetical protein [Bdellovibrionales bacterium]
MKWIQLLIRISSFGVLALAIFAAQNCTQFKSASTESGIRSLDSTGVSVLPDAQRWAASPTKSCASGFSSFGNQCVASYAPHLSLSSQDIAPGGSVIVQWSGGVYAATCSLTLSDSQRTGYAPWAPSAQGSHRVDHLTLDTEFKLVCLDSSGGYLQPQPTLQLHIEKNPLVKSYLNTMMYLNLNRYDLWNRTAGIWESWYDGVDTAADHATSPYIWDVPIDDDSLEDYEAGRGFRFNTPSQGFLTIDRATNPLDWHKGGALWRRDEFLRMETGLTFEFRMKLQPNSGLNNGGYDAFNFYYVMNDGSVIGLFISPGIIKAGGYGFPEVSAPLDTVGDFNTYRVVQLPGEARFHVYVNDSATPILTASGNARFRPNTLSNQDYPIFILGGESAYRVHFILDYARYRRGAYPPGSSFPMAERRAPVLLPTPLPPDKSENFIPAGFDAVQFVKDPYGIFGSFSSEAGGCQREAWTISADKKMVYNAVNGSPATCLLRSVPSLIGRGDVTLEVRLKVMKDSENRGFSIFHIDETGTMGMVFSPGRVELPLGIKNVGYRDVGYQSATIDATNGYHIYRLVRAAGQLYAHLYIDNNPVPILYDQHLEATGGMALNQEVAAIEFGHMLNPGRGRGHVLIDYIRWAPTAYAPPVKAR